jgi:plastocyanin
MKNVIQVIVIAVLGFSSSAIAQQTYGLDWAIGINGSAASLTIEAGDTVEWTWTDALNHSVTSDGDAQESFDSGIIGGLGSTFSYTFNQVGTNGYHCTPHSSSMFGVITVEQDLSIEDKFQKNVTTYMDQTTGKIMIQSLLTLTSFEVFNILGVQQHSGALVGTSGAIEMNGYASGVYIVVLHHNEQSVVIKVAKR